MNFEDDNFNERIQERLDLFSHDEGIVFAPLSTAVTDYIEFAQHPEDRVWTGIQEIDDATRGIAPGECCQINGFAHNGKTVLVVECLLKNEGRPGLMFTPDETRSLVLSKLTSAIHQVSAEEVERRLNQHDAQMIGMLNEVAERFAGLAVIDDSVTLHGMDQAYDSMVEAVGPPAYVIFDYADLLDEPIETPSKLRALKAWGKRKKVPLILLHQSSKSAGGGGRVVTMESGSHDRGDTATFIIGVRRKINMLRDQIRICEEKLANTEQPRTAERLSERIREIEEILIPRHRETITVSLVKNKRPPGRLVEEIDFKLDQDTGRLIPIVPDDDPDALPDPPQEPTFHTGMSARDLLSQKKTP